MTMSVFQPVRFWVNRLPDWRMFGGCDPSMGRGETSDPSSLLIGGRNRLSGVLHVEVAEIKRRVPSKLEADLIRLQREFECLAWGFENNNAYEHSRQTFVQAGLAQGVPLPLVGLTASVPPEVRIESLEPLITDPAVPGIVFASHLTQLLAELDAWPEPQSGHHFDGLCGLWLLHQVAVRSASGLGISSRPRRRDAATAAAGAGDALDAAGRSRRDRVDLSGYH